MSLADLRVVVDTEDLGAGVMLGDLRSATVADLVAGLGEIPERVVLAACESAEMFASFPATVELMLKAALAEWVKVES